MRAQTLTDILNKTSRAAVSNVTGREASKVTMVTQRYGRNIVGGWALGKGGDQIAVEQHPSIPVFSTYADMLEALPVEQHPNKITIYSPPEAVYGDIKNALSVSSSTVETIFIVTEHVAIEVAGPTRIFIRAAPRSSPTAATWSTRWPRICMARALACALAFRPAKTI
ncbi:MAG: hypothetical protein NTV22_04155 [bacterium]|nr:hypothetical protein [bacterium]